MRFLIAGYGSIGRRHFENLVALGERDISFYRTRRSTLPDAALDGYPIFGDLQAALDLQPAAVVVSNPTALHLEVAVPAAAAGCSLLLEKPISHTFEGIDRLLDAVVKGGSSVLVGYQFRFHPGLRRLADLLAEGAIGRPLSFRAHWGEYLPGWHPWEDYRQGYSARPDLGGGVILTLSHPLDYARWLLGEVEAVWAFASRESDLALLVEDTAEIGMRFASGAIGSIHLNYTQQPPAHHLEIIGSEGTLRWDNMHGSTRLFRAGGESWESFPLPDDFSRNTLFLTEMRHFLDMVRVNAQPACTLEDGIQALMLAEAALESARTGQLITL